MLIRIEISIFREQNQHEATYLNAELLLLPSNIREIGIYLPIVGKYVLEFKFHQTICIEHACTIVSTQYIPTIYRHTPCQTVIYRLQQGAGMNMTGRLRCQYMHAY